jgi:hypothetical protein
VYESALNERFDVAEERAHVGANEIPETVLLLLGATVTVASGLFAGVLGRNGKKRVADVHLLALATWLVVALIVDLDRSTPRLGAGQPGTSGAAPGRLAAAAPDR